jgi:hypothetical protein
MSIGVSNISSTLLSVRVRRLRIGRLILMGSARKGSSDVIQKSLIDIQFERAMRWTSNKADDGLPPPAHIAEKIAAVAPHMKREEEADDVHGDRQV